MKKFSALFLYILLAVGIILIIGGLVLLVLCSRVPHRHVFLVWPTVILSVGALLIYISLAFTHLAHQLFVGMNFCFTGLLILILQTGITAVRMRELWPVSVIFCGLSLAPSGYFQYRRLRTVYLFPAGLLVFLGAFFCLFSFHVIKMPLRVFISMWWPAVLVVIGGLLVTIFQYQRNNAFPYMTDDSVDDTDTADDTSDNPAGDDK